MTLWRTPTASWSGWKRSLAASSSSTISTRAVLMDMIQCVLRNEAECTALLTDEEVEAPLLEKWTRQKRRPQRLRPEPPLLRGRSCP